MLLIIIILKGIILISITLKGLKLSNVVNPFYYGNEVHNDDFCNRVNELNELKSDVLSGLNVLIYAPRRFGKTSLLKKLQDELSPQNDFIIIYFDIFTVSSIDEFIQKYFNLLAKNFESTTDKIINLFKNILKIRPNITMKLSSHSDISYGLALSKKEESSTLEEVLNLPYLYAKKFNKKVVVIFDEFQEIEALDIEKKLRSVIQSHSRDVSYLFSGSKKSMLREMFNDQKRAFYKSVKHLKIDAIQEQDWIKFIDNKFSNSAKKIESDLIKKCFFITQGYPYYMQQLMYFVWSYTENEVDEKIVQNSIDMMLERESDIYSLVWTNLTPNQKITLKYIVEKDGETLYSNANMNETSLSASTLKSTLSSLIKKDIIDKNSEKYYVIDPFMKYWLQNV